MKHGGGTIDQIHDLDVMTLADKLGATNRRLTGESEQKPRDVERVVAIGQYS